MRVVKNINNNVSLCLDSEGREVIAFGKGIGFTKPPYEIPLEKIERTFYDVNENFLNVIAQIPEEIMDVSAKIVDRANKKLNHRYSANTIFTLADHIQFAIKRKKEEINIQSPLMYEIYNLYPDELEIGLDALKVIERDIHVSLPKEEATGIAMHFVNFGKATINKNDQFKSKIDVCSDIVERMMNIKIVKNGFNYSRFVTHMHYLMDRVYKGEQITSVNEKLFNNMLETYPRTYGCAIRIEKELELDLSDEEVMYLILHINRLCTREDCDQ